MIFTLNLTDNFAQKIVDFILFENPTPLQMAQMQISAPVPIMPVIKSFHVRFANTTPTYS